MVDFGAGCSRRAVRCSPSAVDAQARDDALLPDMQRDLEDGVGVGVGVGVWVGSGWRACCTLVEKRWSAAQAIVGQSPDVHQAGRAEKEADC